MINVNRCIIALDCLDSGSLYDSRASGLRDIVKLNKAQEYDMLYRSVHSRLKPSLYGDYVFSIEPKTEEEYESYTEEFEYELDYEEVKLFTGVDFIYEEDNSFFAKQRDVIASAFSILNDLQYKTRSREGYYTTQITVITNEQNLIGGVWVAEPEDIVVQSPRPWNPDTGVKPSTSMENEAHYVLDTEDDIHIAIYKKSVEKRITLEFTSSNFDLTESMTHVFFSTIRDSPLSRYEYLYDITKEYDTSYIDLVANTVTNLPPPSPPNYWPLSFPDTILDADDPFGRLYMSGYNTLSNNRNVVKCRKFADIQEVVDLIQS